MTQVLPSGVFTDLAKNFRHPYRSLASITEDEEFGNLPDYKSDEDKNEEDIEDSDDFSWTQEQFDALIEGDTTNRGKGGTNYKDIISKHGLPDSEIESTSGGYEIKKNHLSFPWFKHQDSGTHFRKAGKRPVSSHP